TDRRYTLVAEKKSVLDNQHAIRVEYVHAIIDEPGRQNVIEHTQGIVDAQCVCRLAEAYAGNIPLRAPFDENGLHPPLRETRRSGQTSHPAADHQNTADFAHGGADSLAV